MASNPPPPDPGQTQLDRIEHNLDVIVAFIEDNRPALERAKKFLGNPVKDYLENRKARHGT